VPQDPTLEFPFTALEVVLMGRCPHLAALGFPGAGRYHVREIFLAPPPPPPPQPAMALGYLIIMGVA
jgi:hypothetical protein